MPTSKFHDAREMYDAVHESTKDNIGEAYVWAIYKLTTLEGEGHALYVTGNRDGTVCCSFAKPEWSGDHCGTGMSHAAEAIVMAVCEYICGELK